MNLLASTEALSSPALDAKRLQSVFASCFLHSHNTCLQGGRDEPLYQPAAAGVAKHCLYFRADYFASALHEIAHWCIAGAQRRGQVDYGYWYAPDGRNLQQQEAFETVESKPQALEWFFAKACDYPFRLSIDNLDPISGTVPDVGNFSRKVFEQTLSWQVEGLPARGAQFFDALCREFGTATRVRDLQFNMAELG